VGIPKTVPCPEIKEKGKKSQTLLERQVQRPQMKVSVLWESGKAGFDGIFEF